MNTTHIWVGCPGDACTYLLKKRENSNITQMIHLLVELLTFYKTTRAG